MSSITTQVDRPQLLRVGDLARLTGKTVRAIHLYEELGLLQPSRRSSGGFRLYDASVVERVRWIDLLHGLGFSLQEMRELVKSWWTAELGPEAMSELRALFQRKLDETRAAVARYEQLEGELRQGLAYLETCRVCATREATRGCVHCQQDHGMSDEPALVAGIMATPGRGGHRATAVPGLVRVETIAPRNGPETDRPGSDRVPELRKELERT
jgi:DNA-binding transcriptional MerR regulator